MARPLFARPEGDVVSFELVVPTGEPGLRHYGKRVVVLVDRELGVDVLSPVFSRTILRGAWNYTDVVWEPVAEGAEQELCWTALDIIGAQVGATLKLFRRGYLDPRWLSERARWEVLS